MVLLALVCPVAEAVKPNTNAQIICELFLDAQRSGERLKSITAPTVYRSEVFPEVLKIKELSVAPTVLTVEQAQALDPSHPLAAGLTSVTQFLTAQSLGHKQIHAAIEEGLVAVALVVKREQFERAIETGLLQGDVKDSGVSLKLITQNQMRMPLIELAEESDEVVVILDPSAITAGYSFAVDTAANQMSRARVMKFELADVVKMLMQPKADWKNIGFAVSWGPFPMTSFRAALTKDGSLIESRLESHGYYRKGEAPVTAKLRAGDLEVQPIVSSLTLNLAMPLSMLVGVDQPLTDTELARLNLTEQVESGSSPTGMLGNPGLWVPFVGYRVGMTNPYGFRIDGTIVNVRHTTGVDHHQLALDVLHDDGTMRTVDVTVSSLGRRRRTVSDFTLEYAPPTGPEPLLRLHFDELMEPDVRRFLWNVMEGRTELRQKVVITF